jgi:hypothetical protein
MSRFGPAAVLLLSCSLLSAQQQPKGIPARSTPADYTAQVTVSGVTYAASLVPPNEVKHLFASDISKRYVVFEVAVYPSAASSVDIDPEGFLVRSSQSGESVRRSDSVTVASAVRPDNFPRESTRPVDVTAGTEVGYESGRDPYTGQRIHGTYTATQVGVSNRDNAPAPPPSSSSYGADRDLLERQLWAKSLPGGQLHQPSAGYLYFPSSLLKKKASGTYQLEYEGSQQPVLNNSSSASTIQLQIPAKVH